MIKGNVLNQSLLKALSTMGHSDMLMVVDAGFPIPETGCQKVELAIAPGLPDIPTVLRLLVDNFSYEEFYTSNEMAEKNKALFSEIKDIVTECPISLVPHDEIMFEYTKKAKVIIRTGDFNPWGNMAFISGVDVKKWFLKDGEVKEGMIVPEHYKARVFKK